MDNKKKYVMPKMDVVHLRHIQKLLDDSGRENYNVIIVSPPKNP